MTNAFLSLAHERKFLTRRQAQEIYAEKLWCEAHGLHALSGELAVDLGYLDKSAVASILAYKESGLQVSDVLRRGLFRRLSRPAIHSGLILSILTIWAVMVRWFDIEGDIAGGILAAIYICVENLINAREPYPSLGPKFLRIGWSEMVRWLLFLGWVLTLGYCVWGWIAMQDAANTASQAPQRLRFISSALVFAAFSGTYVLGVHWRRTGLRASDIRGYHLIALLNKCTYCRDMVTEGGLSSEEIEQARDECVKEVVRRLAHIVQCNPWVSLLSWLSLLRGRSPAATRSVLVSYCEPSHTGPGFDIKEHYAPDCPDDIKVVLSALKDTYHPVVFNKDWFGRTLERIRSMRPVPKDTIKAFRREPDRRYQVSFAGAAYETRRAYSAPRLSRCRSWDESYLEIVRARCVNRSVSWLSFASGAVCPVPPNLNEDQHSPMPHGVLMVLRNVEQGVRAEDRRALASASRALTTVLNCCNGSTAEGRNTGPHRP